MTTLRLHWREYVSEALCLGLFMLSAAAFATLFQHPDSPWQLGMGASARLPMGAAMGLTLVALVYSPLGQRSGAHMNPVVTLTFLRLGKIAPRDAVWYIAAQIVGGVAGIVAATWLMAGWPAHPTVDYVATRPGPYGALAAVSAEALIAFGLMLTVLVVSNHQRLSRWTGVCAAVLVCLYITVEAPLSGMSMNPARSLGPALLAGATKDLWVYFLGPLVGMGLAAHVYVWRSGLSAVRCAKFDHPPDVPCIFRCSHNF